MSEDVKKQQDLLFFNRSMYCTRRRSDSSKDAHDTFMKNYSKILKPPEEKLPALDIKPHVNNKG
jgi:hypothetical protein